MSRGPRYIPREVDGLLLLDKAAGITSNTALQQVKRLFRAAKAGHTGSLDPLASGLLPLCFGEATKLSGFLLAADKRYTATLRLGMTTRTGDGEGEVTSTQPVPTLSERQLEGVLSRFRGTVEQMPPMYSALKHQGKRLYVLARQGREVERAPRCITIHALRLVGFGESHLALDVHCSKGTYIRTLAEDIGAALGCGAYVESLRRTAVGRFEVGDAYTLEQLTGWSDDARTGALLAPDLLVAHLPSVTLGSDLIRYLRRGEAVLVPRTPATDRMFRVYDRNGVFYGIGETLDDGRLAPRRLLRGKAQAGGR